MILKQVIHYPDTNSVEATWVDENNIPIKCHSYADSQMDMLETNLGAEAINHAELIALVRLNRVPITQPDPIPIMWEKIKAERDDRIFNGGVNVGTMWFLSTERARTEYTTMLVLTSAYPPDTVIRAGWRTMQVGVEVDMTPNLLSQILVAGMAVVAAIDDVAQAHIAAMTASADPASYDYSTGWPEHFIA